MDAREEPVLTNGEGPPWASLASCIALAELEMTDGRAVSDEIVAEIFKHFCVGK